MTKVFVDGSSGTTGLKIFERLESRSDIELIKLDEKFRKDPLARKEALNSADIAFLCLPDAAAIEAVELIESGNVAVIDTSTAHRTNENWTYGFAEITGQKEKISRSKRIANPGCHASGFVSLIEPLREKGLITADEKLNCFSLTGYSGGGKKMIAEYESAENELALKAPRIYGLTQQHKHLPEMSKVCSLNNMPLFSPIVSSYYSGMAVTVQLYADQVNGNINDIKNVYKEHYTGKIITFSDSCDEQGFISGGRFAGRDDMEIGVFGNDERITLVSRFDNLGKGASGAAIQNMNIVLGIDETYGLKIGG